METLLFLVILFSVASSETNTLKQGDVLVLNATESTVLFSANKNFSLGFSLSYPGIYLAIQFANGYGPAWIGNRETPFHANSSAKLLIDASGRLILTNDDEKNQGSPYLLSSKKTSLNVTATLLDSGNLVLREMNPNGSFGQQLWSSFDHPTDTLLPDMKLGVNHITGRNWSLTSWLRDDTPTAGPYSLEWEPTKRRLVIKYRGVVRWTSGALEDAAHFKHFPFSYGTENIKFHNISTKEEEYFSYSIKPVLDPFQPNKTLDGWRLDSRGILMSQMTSMVVDTRDCYGYEDETQQSRGCELWEQPKCRGNGETFVERSGSFFDGRQPARSRMTQNSSDGPSDCRENCWNDCECVGYKFYTNGGCIYYRGTHLQFEQDVSGHTVTKYVLTRQEGDVKWIRILIATLLSCIFIVPFVLFLLRRRRRIQEEARRDQELVNLLTLDGYTDIYELDKSDNAKLKLFSYKWIVATTNNFSSSHKLGQGGFGSVYKGATPEGQEVAIKQLSKSSKQGIMEFKNEAVLIAKLQHTNLVKLLGICIQGDQKMLIYEFLPNKSLDFFLFDPDKKEQLTWERRLNIIEGIAQGLLYLHKYSRLKIIHRDMKASNILLDENMNPKISDFGMAKILRQNVTEANTMKLAGTYGYMAPEYAMEGIYSTKSDVYSFGVLVLEIVSGKKNNFSHSEDGPLNLIEHAWELWKGDTLLELVDPALGNICGKEEQLHRCLNMGLLCVEDFAVDRPSMSDVIYMITNENMTLPKPKKPAFISRYGVANELQAIRSEKFTINELSLSVMEAR